MLPVIFTYGSLRLEVPEAYSYVYYATFLAGVYDFLKVKKDDVVLDAGAFIGDFTVKIAKRAKEVIAVEPLPWAFEILKRNVETNNLKNVVLINKALYSVDGVKVKLKDEGVGSSISGEGEFEVETVTVDSLGRFSIVKMDIEGAEEELIRDDSDWLNHVRAMAIEVHGEKNLANVPKVLVKKGFTVREMSRTDLIKNALRNILPHSLDFLRAKIKTKYLLNMGKIIFKAYILRQREAKIIYALRKSY